MIRYYGMGSVQIPKGRKGERERGNEENRVEETKTLLSREVKTGCLIHTLT